MGADLGGSLLSKIFIMDKNVHPLPDYEGKRSVILIRPLYIRKVLPTNSPDIMSKELDHKY